MTPPSPPVGPAISGATRVAAVVGDPVAHSLSPAIHNAAFAARGLDWVFVALPTPRGGGAQAVAALSTLGIAGLSVTMPLKGEVAAAVDRLSPLAGAVGAVNCVVVEAGEVVGHNTDATGAASALAAAGRSVPGARVLVVGAGGAGRAVVAGLLDAGASEVVVANRDPERAEQAVGLDPERCRRAAGGTPSPEEVAAADIVVNATPVGMGQASDGAVSLPTGSLHADQAVVELVYHPVRTALVAAADAVGAQVVDGVAMLVHQAAHAFALWTGEPAPLAAMAAAAEDAVGGSTGSTPRA